MKLLKIIPVAVALTMATLALTIAPDNTDKSVVYCSQDMAEKWADSVMSGLSLKQRIAQLFIPRLDITDNKAGFDMIDRTIGVEQMGGFLLGKGTIDSYAALINYGQSKARVPLMITLDGEWGLSMRVKSTPRFPYNIALGAANDEQLMYDYGVEMARECRLMGIQVNFAPVLDVNSNPGNPVIGYRSFGENPMVVGRLGAAYCKGMSDGGVMSVGKHFPGHGDTSVDSHKALPTVSHSVETFNNVDFMPFRIAIESGMPGVMVGHLNVPSLDPDGVPSSLSRIVTTGWLQDSLGFKGLIFTDALAMKGALRKNENNCVSAFKAGADVLLGSSNPVSDINAMVSAVKSGGISQSDVDLRCKKILMWKYRLGLSHKPHVDIDKMKNRLNTVHVDSMIMEMSRKAVTVVRNTDNSLPIKSGKKVVVISLGTYASNLFADECKKYGDVKTYAISNSGSVTPDILREVKTADIVIIAVFKDATWIRKAFKELVKANDAACGVFLLNPFKIHNFAGLDSLRAIMLTYDDIPQLRVAAAQALFGLNPVGGVLPVNLPGIADMSTSVQY